MRILGEKGKNFKNQKKIFIFLNFLISSIVINFKKKKNFFKNSKNQVKKNYMGTRVLF